MRHAPKLPARLIALVLPLLVAAGADAQPTPTPTPNPIYLCADKITRSRGLGGDYTNDALGEIFECALKRLSGQSCPAPQIEDENQDLVTHINGTLNGGVYSGGCDAGAIDALCAFGADTKPEMETALIGAPATSIKNQLIALVDEIFFEENGTCPRPTTPLSNSSAGRKCADDIQNAIEGQETIARMGEAFFSCERARLNKSGLELCTDDASGEPIKEDVASKEADALANGLDKIDPDVCDEAAIEELGCPLGAETTSQLKSELADRLTTFVRNLNLGIFHSPCQGSLPGGPSEPVPAQVTLEPSMTKKQITCGQTIDAAFMGSDSTISFDTDLDCSAAKTPVAPSTTIDGITIAKPGVKLNGRLKTRTIRGPSRSSLRTGVGIRLAPGVARVQIRNFKAIENWGVGIQDADGGDNKKLIVIKNTVRRNVIAGMRIRSKRARLDTNVVDKNGIGLDLSGKGTRVRSSQISGSLYEPKVGIRLSGTDLIYDGMMVQILGSPAAPTTVELNQGIGIQIVEGAHTVRQVQVRSNTGAGIKVEPLATGSQLRSNVVKLNAQGIVVEGDSVWLDANTAEENLGDGYVVGGVGNVVQGNHAGKKTDRGNGGNGFTITGTGVALFDNDAEANLGSGFVFTPESTTIPIDPVTMLPLPPLVVKSNSAQSNHKHGFDIQSGGHVFDSCNAEDNPTLGGSFHEWVLVAGNSDTGDSNKAGGGTIGIPADGGFCDDGDDCPVND